MEVSPVFYGYYSGTFIFDLNGVPYNFPLAYFLVMLGIFALNLMAMVKSSAKSFRTNTLSIADSDTSHFVNMVLAGWDHGMSSTERKDADNQQRRLAGRLKFELEELQFLQQVKDMTRSEQCKLKTVRVLIWILTVTCLAGLALFMLFVSSNWMPSLRLEYDCSLNPEYESEEEYDSKHTVTCLAVEYIPSIVITVANIVFPLVFTFLVQFEKYSAHSSLLVDLARSVFLRLTSLFIAFITVFFAVECDYAQGCSVTNANATVELPGEDGNCTDGSPPDLTACYNNGWTQLGGMAY